MAERTEAPTPRRREEARRQGQVAKSVEVNSAAILLGAFWVLSASGPRSADALSTLMRRSFATLGTTEITAETLRVGGLTAGLLMAQAIAPLVLTVVVVGVVANLAQVGFLFSGGALRPDLNRVNPISGLRRIFSVRGAVELLKSLLKLVLIGFVVFIALRDSAPLVAGLGRLPLGEGVKILATIGITVGLRVAGAMLVIAAADYLFQRRQFEKSLRMTRQELIEELKRYDNPQLKARVRARQRQIAMSRMMAAVPKADVVITNPTHIAVALQYDRATMRAPQVVAKGQRLIAERIKETAREHRVPVVENKALARSLFQTVEIGREVPVELYQAVAEVLAFVYRLRQSSSRHTAAGSSF